MIKEFNKELTNLISENEKLKTANELLSDWFKLAIVYYGGSLEHISGKKVIEFCKKTEIIFGNPVQLMWKDNNKVVTKSDIEKL